MLVLVMSGTLAAAAETGNVPVEPMTFEGAVKRHETLVKEYKENAAKIEQLTARNQQLMIEINYLSGFLDALLHVTRTLDQFNERALLTSTTRMLRLPPPNWAGPSATTSTLARPAATVGPSESAPAPTIPRAIRRPPPAAATPASDVKKEK